MKKASVVLSTLILLSSVAGCTATNETTAKETRYDDTDVSGMEEFLFAAAKYV